MGVLKEGVPPETLAAVMITDHLKGSCTNIVCNTIKHIKGCKFVTTNAGCFRRVGLLVSPSISGKYYRWKDHSAWYCKKDHGTISTDSSSENTGVKSIMINYVNRQQQKVCFIVIFVTTNLRTKYNPNISSHAQPVFVLWILWSIICMWRFTCTYWRII